MSVTPSQFDLLSRLLDAASLRHRVIAQNVANVNTPGYRRRDVAFDDALARELDRGSDSQPASVRPMVIEAAGGTLRQDGNNVDIDAEMGRLNKNTLLYGAYSQILAAKIAAMKAAISGR
jgi:flagellar basal-body rod protein FlgB